MSQLPDKIWLHKDTKYSTADTVCGYQYKFLAEDEGIENFVEYIRIDAFIKKADEFISTFFHPDDTELKKGVLDEFHKYMKGAGYAWDDEKKEVKKVKKIEQKSAEWSEEDEEQVSIITNIIKAHCGKLIDCESNLSWLQSIKQRYTWKPSDEQMENLSRAVNGGSYRTSLLMELYQDLKKLKGE